jgi:hypothetical protein
MLASGLILAKPLRGLESTVVVEAKENDQIIWESSAQGELGLGKAL